MTVDSSDATGPDGFSTSTVQCPSGPLRGVHVAPVAARAVQDGSYEINGTGEDGTFRGYGEGAPIEWFGSFRTPIVGDPDSPANCEDLPTQASILGWGSIYADGSNTFTAHGNGGILGQVTLTGHS